MTLLLEKANEHLDSTNKSVLVYISLLMIIFYAYTCGSNTLMSQHVYSNVQNELFPLCM